MLLAILIPLAALAAPARTPVIFCANSQAIALSSQICMFNDGFVKQARACLSKLDFLANEASSAMAKNFSPGATDAQAAKFNASSTDYAASLLTLDSLVATNKVAIREVEGYLRDLIHPLDDSDSMSVPCYGDNHRGVSQALKELNIKLTQLEAARSAAAANGGASVARQSSLTGSLGAPAPAHGKAESAPASRAAFPRPSASDITGTKPEKP